MVRKKRVCAWIAYWRRRIDFLCRTSLHPSHKPRRSEPCLQRKAPSHWEKPGFSTTECFNQRPLIYLSSTAGVCVGPFLFPSLLHLSLCLSLRTNVRVVPSVIWALCGSDWPTPSNSTCWHGDGNWLTAALTLTTMPASLWPGVGMNGSWMREKHKLFSEVQPDSLFLSLSLCIDSTKIYTSQLNLSIQIFWHSWDFRKTCLRYSDTCSASKVIYPLMTDRISRDRPRLVYSVRSGYHPVRNNGFYLSFASVSSSLCCWGREGPLQTLHVYVLVCICKYCILFSFKLPLV